MNFLNLKIASRKIRLKTRKIQMKNITESLYLWITGNLIMKESSDKQTLKIMDKRATQKWWQWDNKQSLIMIHLPIWALVLHRKSAAFVLIRSLMLWSWSAVMGAFVMNAENIFWHQTLMFAISAEKIFPMFLKWIWVQCIAILSKWSQLLLLMKIQKKERMATNRRINNPMSQCL